MPVSFTPDGEPLARTLGNLAVEMRDQKDPDATLRTIVAAAVAIVPGARWAGISLIQGRTIEPRVPSDPLVAELDALQSELNDGPCITALREHHTVHVDDMESESRWTTFAEAAVGRGVRSMLSFQLFVARDNLGALNLYGEDAGVFTDESFAHGEILAQHAAVAMVGSNVEQQMHRALASRDVIGQAKGIIMERFDVDAVQAFALLTRLSQTDNTKLAAVAQQVIDTRSK